MVGVSRIKPLQSCPFHLNSDHSIMLV